jgi:hypothetical protein
VRLDRQGAIGRELASAVLLEELAGVIAVHRRTQWLR